MPRTLDLNETDRAALAELLRETIAADRYLLSRRIRKLRAILEKLEPPPPRTIPRPRSVISAREAGFM